MGHDMTPETLRPCDKDCMGYICAFHSLPRYVQDELTTLRKRLEAAREGWDLCLAELKRRDKRLEAAKTELRSEFRCRGLTDAEIAAEFAALAGEEKP